MAFSWTELLPWEQVVHIDNAKTLQAYASVATAGIATTLLMGVAIAGRKALGSGEAAVLPSGKFGVRAIFETITEYIRGLCTSVIGSHGAHWTPFFAAIFTFVLFNNLFGMIPGVTPATENLNMTFAMGLAVFIGYNVLGVYFNGWGYLKHFLGPIWWLGPFMLVLELISHAVRPVSLGLRLGFVMLGDHTVLGVALGLAPIVAPIPFYVLGLIVSLIQAIVFTLLSMVYVAMATAHDH